MLDDHLYFVMWLVKLTYIGLCSIACSFVRFVSSKASKSSTSGLVNSGIWKIFLNRLYLKMDAHS
jgi:hypothetical protein